MKSRLLLAVCVALAGCRALSQIEYRLTEPTNVSLAVYDPESGALLRTLLSGQPQAAGTHTVAWDGLDRLGQPLAPGRYRWRLLDSPGLRAEYVMTLGTSAPWASWDFWPGNHAGVTAVAVQDGRVVYGSGTSEGPPTFVCTSLDGRTLVWKRLGLEAWQGAMAMTTARDASTAAGAAGVYYVLQNNGVVWKQRFDAEWPGFGIRWNLAWPKAGETIDPTGYALGRVDLAAQGDVIVAAYKEHDAIRWVDATYDPTVPDGGEAPAARVLDEARVPQPVGVAVTAGGDVLVSSGNQVVRLSRQDKTLRPFLTGLSAPGRLDVDEASGEILVFDGGAAQQVKRFAADGTLLATYGRPGGRNAEGLFEPEHFRDVVDVAHDGVGGFFVTEPDSAPRRAAHFDAGGKLLDERYGGQMFCTAAEPDPRDPTIVWMQSHWGWLAKLRLDYAARTWRVEETYKVAGKAGGLIDKLEAGPWRVRYAGEHCYLVRDTAMTPRILRYDLRSHRLAPVVITDMNISGGGYNRLTPQVKALLGNDPKTTINSFIWTDANGDEQPQDDEFRFSEGAGWYFEASVTDGLVFYGRTSFGPGGRPGKEFSKLVRLAPTGFTDTGTPLYADFPNVTDYRFLPTDLRFVEAVVNACTFVAPDGPAYSAANVSDGDCQGTVWPGYFCRDNKIIQWDQSGDVKWVVGRHATTPWQEPPPPGELHMPTKILGTHRGSVLVAERVVTPLAAWDEHGLYVGRLFDRRADDGLPPEVYHWFKVPGKDDGNYAILNYDMLIGGAVAEVGPDLYFFGSGWNCVPVYRVTGWDELRRQTGELLLAEAPPAAQARGTGLRADYFANRDLVGPAAVTRDTEMVSVNWGANAPEPDLPAEGFSVRWEGEIEMPFTETFRFGIKNNGGARVWLDGNLILDDWRDYDGTALPYTNERYRQSISEPLPLRAGQRCRLRIEFYKSPRHLELPHEARFQLDWESATLSRQAVPVSALYPAPGQAVAAP